MFRAHRYRNFLRNIGLGPPPDQTWREGSPPIDDLFRPVMVIGCGGSGTLVVKGLKQRLGSQGGPGWRNLFQLLAVDTEPVTLAHSQHLDGREFKNLAQMTIRGDDIIEDMINPDTSQIYEHLQTWWPDQEGGQGPYRPGVVLRRTR